MYCRVEIANSERGGEVMTIAIGKFTMILFVVVAVPLSCVSNSIQMLPAQIIANNKTSSISKNQISSQVVCALPAQHSCYSFKRNQHRVDFVCRDILQQVSEALRESPNIKVVIYGYRAENEKKGLDFLRATAVQRHLTNSASRPKLKSQQVVIRANGIATDGTQVKMYLVPMDTDLP